MADAHFQVAGRRIAVFGPRAEQVAHLLELEGDRTATKLAARIASHVADAESGDDVLELDESERRKLLDALEQVAAAAQSEPPDLLELRGALAESLN